MTIVRTLRKWLHRDAELDEVARARRWAAERERYAVRMSDAEFEEMVKRDEANPAVRKAFEEAQAMRQQGSETHTEDGLPSPAHGERQRDHR